MKIILRKTLEREKNKELTLLDIKAYYIKSYYQKNCILAQK